MSNKRTVTGTNPLELKGSFGKPLSELIVKGNSNLEPSVPYGYAELEYIATPSDASNVYINTGILLDQDCVIEAKFAVATNLDRYLYGAQNSSGTNAAGLSPTAAPFGGSGADATGTNYVNITQYSTLEITQSSTGIKINDVTSHTYTNPSFSTTPHCAIFRMTNGNDSTFVTSAVQSARCYYFRIIKNGTTLFNGIPARLVSSGAIGIYDTISMRLLEGTSGSLTAGPDVWDLESVGDKTNLHNIPAFYYQELDYLSAGLASDAINTGWKGESGLSVEVKFSLNSTSNLSLFGVATSTCKFWAGITNAKYNCGVGAGAEISSPIPLPNQITTLKLETNSEGWTAYINGISVATGTDVTTASDPNGQLYILKLNDIASQGFSGLGSKIYSVRLYNSFGTMREFYPVKRLSDNVIGLYDVISGDFLSNIDTTHNLTAGNNIGQNQIGLLINSTDNLATPTTQSLSFVSTIYPLNSIGDTVYDTYNSRTRTITRNCGKMLFTGSEPWVLTNTYFASLPQSYLNTTLPANTTDFLVNYFIPDVSGSVANTVFFDATNLNYCVLGGKKFNTLSEWTTYLATCASNGHPVGIIYPLDTTSTVSVTSTAINTINGDGYLSISGFDPLEMTAIYYGLEVIKLTRAQYNSITPNPAIYYIISDEAKLYLGSRQVTTNPTIYTT